MSKVKRTEKRMTYSSSEQSDNEVNLSQQAHQKLSSKSHYNNVINPEIMTYITRVQGERDKTSKKVIIADSQEKKQDNSQYNGLNDNMNVDKAQKSFAKKGLLYLLNNLSGGTFCPEINVYFEEMKEMKKSEIVNKPFKGHVLPRETVKATANNHNTHNNNNSDANLALTPKSTLLRRDLRERERERDTPFAHNFKRRKGTNDNEDKEEEGFGMKAFREDLAISNKKEDNSTASILNANQNPVTFNFNKEKQAKMKIMPKEKKKKKKVSSYIDNNTNHYNKTELLEENSSLRRQPNRNSTQKYNMFIKNQIFEAD